MALNITESVNPAPLGCWVNRNKIYIIIPCYNEAKRIIETLDQVRPYGTIVVVDDGSTDGSAQLAESQGVIVLKHLLNRGQGASLETGNRYALKQQAEIVVHFDADGQHLASEIPKLVELIGQGKTEVVLGSRFLRENSQTPFFKKWLILKPAILFQNFISGVKLTDAHNGFRAFSRSALEKIRITQDRMAHPTEIIEQIANNQLNYLEVPVTIRYHEFGQSFLDGLRIIRDIIFKKINK